MKDLSNLNYVLDTFADVIAEKVLQRLGHDVPGRARPEPRLLTVEEAAARLGRTPQALYHMIGAGRLPVVRSDRRVFVDAQDLERFIQANKICNN